MKNFMKTKHVVARFIDGSDSIERQFFKVFTNELEALKEFDNQKGESDGESEFERIVTAIWLNVRDANNLDLDLADDLDISWKP